jgi:uncharacterized protein (TIGR02099 family)
MRLRKFGKVLLFCLAGLLGLVCILMLCVKLALDRVPAYQDEIKAWVHTQTGLHIRFAHVAPSLRWYGPELHFDRLELRSKDDQRILARAADGWIGLDVWELLRSGKLFAGRVRIDSPDIVIARLGPNEFALASELELRGEHRDLSLLSLDDLPVGDFQIRGGRLTVERWNSSLPELVLDEVSIDLLHESDRASLSLGARLPPSLGGALAVGLHAAGLGKLASLAWRIDLHARGIDFSGWHLLLPEYLGNLDAGSGTFQLTANGQGIETASAKLSFSAQNVVTALVSGPQPKFDQLGGDVSLTHAADRWSLSGRRIRALRAGHDDPISQFNLDWRASPAGLLELHADTNHLRAEGVLPLTGLLPQQDLRERLVAAAPTGEWLDARLDLDRAAVGDAWRMQVHAKFRDVGIASMGKVPGLSGVTGEIAGTENGGHVALEVDAGQVTWPWQWPEPVTIDHARTTLYWKGAADGLLIATPGFELRNHDAAASGRAALRLRPNGDSPYITLLTELHDGIVAETHSYLPRAIIPPRTLDWLTQSLQSGRLRHADVLLQGPLRSFPFRDGSGVFLAHADFEGGTLGTYPNWPAIEGMSASVLFHNQGMSAQLLAGTAHGVKLVSGDAQFPDFKTGELRIHVLASGDADDALQFMRATPLDEKLDKLFSAVSAAGPLQTKVNLFLPFHDFVHMTVQVHGDLDGVTLERSGLPLTASEMTGDFDLEGGELAHADLRGRLLGGAFRAQSRAPRARPLTRSQIDLHGSFSGDALREALGLPASVALRGVSDWRGVVKLAPDPARERSLHLAASLTDLDVSLPAPFAKAAGRPMPSWVDIQWPSGGGTRVNLALGELLRGAFVTASDEQGTGQRLTQAAVMFGDGDPVFSDTQIVNVGGTIDRLDLTGWLQIVRADKPARPLTDFLRTANLQITQVDFIGFSLHSVALGLAARADRWHIAVDGPELAGSISMPIGSDSTEPWDLRFDRVVLGNPVAAAAPAADAAGAPAPAAALAAAPASDPKVISPRSIPAMHVSAGEVTWARAHLGSIEATLTKRDDGVVLDQFTATSPNLQLKAHGEWRGKDPGLGRLQGEITSSDVEAALAQLGAPDVISAKTGRVDFDLNWVGAPTALAFSDSTGRVQVDLEKGQLLGVKPGAGRVLGLASLTALPRRLALDFSDLTDKGLAFDSARGSFDLHGGNAHTDDSLIRGPAAEIGLIGRIGLKTQDYDQTAVVTGNVGGLPMAGIAAGAFAAGPVVGGAVLLFTQVFKQPLKGLARAYYRITGSWENPTIERISKGASTAPAAAPPKESP